MSFNVCRINRNGPFNSPQAFINLRMTRFQVIKLNDLEKTRDMPKIFNSYAVSGSWKEPSTPRMCGKQDPNQGPNRKIRDIDEKGQGGKTVDEDPNEKDGDEKEGGTSKRLFFWRPMKRSSMGPPSYHGFEPLMAMLLSQAKRLKEISKPSLDKRQMYERSFDMITLP